MTEKTAQPDAEVKRRLAVHPPGRKRPVGGPPHLGVEVRFIPLVERAGRPGAERDAQDRGEADHQRRHHRRRQQAAQAGEDDQAHHPRLGQREQVAPVGGKRLVGGQRHGGHAPPYRACAAGRKGQRTRAWSVQAACARVLRCKLESSLPRCARPSPPRFSPSAAGGPRGCPGSEGRSRPGRARDRRRPHRPRARPRPGAGHHRQLPALCRLRPVQRREPSTGR